MTMTSTDDVGLDGDVEVDPVIDLDLDLDLDLGSRMGFSTRHRGTHRQPTVHASLEERVDAVARV